MDSDAKFSDVNVCFHNQHWHQFYDHYVFNIGETSYTHRLLHHSCIKNGNCKNPLRLTNNNNNPASDSLITFLQKRLNS